MLVADILPIESGKPKRSYDPGFLGERISEAPSARRGHRSIGLGSELGCHRLGFRGLGFRGLGFRGLGFRV